MSSASVGGEMITGTPHFAETSFLQSKGLWQPWAEGVFQQHFPATSAYSLSLCHILVIAIFQLFHYYYICYDGA